ncbi:sodium:proton antiporter [Microbacterium sp. 1P10UB]|uniref:cation:proton antiporter n=1 Tax=unclassified Microbacterium TaxID=2609290 RepID=UPI00399F479C
MELGLYGIIAVAVIVAVAAFSKRLGIAAPIILVVVGVALSYLPGVPDIEVPHEIILDGLLPPILYAAAVAVPVMDFRRNLAPIAGLSVALVVVTAFATGTLLFFLLPDLNYAAAVALGAIISPPDAVAATSIGRRLGLPPRLLTLLEGEGLVNDATALVLLRSAVAAAAGGLASPWAGVADFLYAAALAIVIGIVAGIVTVWVRSKLSDPVLDTALSLAVPFVAFTPAEYIGASGILAVVVAGLYTGHAAPRAFSPQSRISDRINWRTIQFLLENGVFLLIGLEIRTLIEDADPEVFSVEASFGIGLLATVVLIVIRYLWVGPLIVALRLRERHAERTTYRALLALYYFRAHPSRTKREARMRNRLERDYGRRRGDLEQQRQERIDWRGGIVLGWAGMRGVVTLAAAQSLPEDTPYRPQLILIAFTVAVASIVLQGGTLPWLIRVLGVQGVDAREDRREIAELLETLSNAGIEELERVVSESDRPYDPDVVERARQSTFLRTEAAWERVDRGRNEVDTPHRLFRELRLTIVAAERQKMLELRALGNHPSRILAEAQALLDLEETRLQRRPGAH